MESMTTTTTVTLVWAYLLLLFFYFCWIQLIINAIQIVTHTNHVFPIKIDKSGWELPVASFSGLETL